MINTQFFGTLWTEWVTRIPYMIAVFVFLILILGFKSYQNTVEGVRIARENSEINRSVLQKIAGLSEDNKRLSEQNNELAQQNATHIDCVAKIFAEYTRDQRPIGEVDLNNCIINSDGTQAMGSSAKIGTTAQRGNAPSATPSQQPSSSPPSTPPPSSPAPPDNNGIIVDLPLLPPIHIPSPL